VIAAAGGDAATAISVLENYAQDLDRAGLNMELIWARIDLGRCLVGVDRDRAIAEFTAAAALAERCGAASDGRIAAQALRRLGVRAWRRGTAGAGIGLLGLSGREQESARRVADGASNREIADSLVLAPKTVERHVSNILAKLGARNRTELAALVHSGSVRDSPDD
jgi:DNA-binding CsgD family transcriptional regulator